MLGQVPLPCICCCGHVAGTVCISTFCTRRGNRARRIVLWSPLPSPRPVRCPWTVMEGLDRTVSSPARGVLGPLATPTGLCATSPKSTTERSSTRKQRSTWKAWGAEFVPLVSGFAPCEGAPVVAAVARKPPGKWPLGIVLTCHPTSPQPRATPLLPTMPHSHAHLPRPPTLFCHRPPLRPPATRLVQLWQGARLSGTSRAREDTRQLLAIPSPAVLRWERSGRSGGRAGLACGPSHRLTSLTSARLAALLRFTSRRRCGSAWVRSLLIASRA